ncbi:MAG: hypothetical protein Ct9H90mP9_4080 [Pseudomonadota bacterium]|nr:MAG: hypothetical protein Ct9H90mP9_4080 [Pseudomonadota bacterium]
MRKPTGLGWRLYACFSRKHPISENHNTFLGKPLFYNKINCSGSSFFYGETPFSINEGAKRVMNPYLGTPKKTREKMARWIKNVSDSLEIRFISRAFQQKYFKHGACSSRKRFLGFLVFYLIPPEIQILRMGVLPENRRKDWL